MKSQFIVLSRKISGTRAGPCPHALAMTIGNDRLYITRTSLRLDSCTLLDVDILQLHTYNKLRCLLICISGMIATSRFTFSSLQSVGFKFKRKLKFCHLKMSSIFFSHLAREKFS